MNIFWGYEDFVDIFLGSSQNWANLRSFLCILGSFLRSMYRIGIFLGVAKIPNILFGVLKFLIFLGGERQMLGPSLRMRKK